MNALRRMNVSDQTAMAELLERWLREAKIDIATPPMLGEDEAEVHSASA
jgi:hypothetical protein